MDCEDKVIKRDGSIENISFDKILARVKNLGNNELKVNYTSLVQKIIDRVYNNITYTQSITKKVPTVFSHTSDMPLSTGG